MPQYGAGAEYALHILVNLASVPLGTAPSARDLADFQRLSVAYVRKLMTSLEKAGLVASAEGVTGGWTLAVPAEQITLLAAVDAVEGRATLFQCRDIRERCALWPDGQPPTAATAGVCSIHAVMLRAEAASRRELARHSIAALARRIRKKSSDDFLDHARVWFQRRVNARHRTSEVSERWS